MINIVLILSGWLIGGHVIVMERARNTLRIFVGKPLEMRPSERRK